MPGANNDWNNSLFGCFDDIGTCCYGYCCLPCLFGSNSKKIDDSNCMVMCCAYCCLTECYLCWVPHYFKRQALREKFGLREDPECGDCLTTLCCGPCAMCQEARELKSRENTPRVLVNQPNHPSPAIVVQPGTGPAGGKPEPPQRV